MPRLLCLLLLSFLISAACVSDEERRGAQAAPVFVEVTNHNVQDMTVFAVGGSQTARLGTVTTNDTQTFEVPRALFLAAGLRLLIDPVGSVQGILTEEIQVGSGETVFLTIQPNLASSFTTVR